MPSPRRSLPLVCLALAASALAAAGGLLADDAPPPARDRAGWLDPRDAGVGRLIEDVAFTDAEGKSGRLSELAGRGALVVALHHADGERAEQQAAAIARLRRAIAERDDVALVVIDPTAERATARALGARTATDAFVLDRARTLVYRGALEDADRSLALEAIGAIAAGRPPALEATVSPGRALFDVARPAPAPADATYHNRISRIVQRRCEGCHRPGMSAPFALRSYADVKGNADMIAFMVGERAMPPWFAAAGHGGPWANDNSLSEEDRAALLSWIEEGCPEGDPADAPLPRRYAEGWKIGEPDLVVEVPKPIAVPAEGTVPYRYVRVRTKLEEDRWVQKVEVQPTAWEQVHHILIFVDYPREHPRARFAPKDFRGGAGYFAGMAPGSNVLALPDGMAKLLPRGATIELQIHYTPNGTATTDRPRIGFVFAKEPPRHEVRTTNIADFYLRIPPGAKNHRVSSDHRFPKAARIIGFLPHMHLRGKAFRYTLIHPDGREQVVLDVPGYDFNWQLDYQLVEPIEVPAGARLRATGWFDNSADNPANPDPTKTVRYGEQTWEEMKHGFFHWYDVDPPAPAPGATSSGPKTEKEKRPVY